MRRNSVFASTMLQHYSLICADNSWHATRLQYNYTVQLRHGKLINVMLPFLCTRCIMIRTGMSANIKLIRKHRKICRILRRESPYFHHRHTGTAYQRLKPHYTKTKWRLYCAQQTAHWKRQLRARRNISNTQGFHHTPHVVTILSLYLT